MHKQNGFVCATMNEKDKSKKEVSLVIYKSVYFHRQFHINVANGYVYEIPLRCMMYVDISGCVEVLSRSAFSEPLQSANIEPKLFCEN